MTLWAPRRMAAVALATVLGGKGAEAAVDRFIGTEVIGVSLTGDRL